MSVLHICSVRTQAPACAGESSRSCPRQDLHCTIASLLEPLLDALSLVGVAIGGRHWIFHDLLSRQGMRSQCSALWCFEALNALQRGALLSPTQTWHISAELNVMLMFPRALRFHHYTRNIGYTCCSLEVLSDGASERRRHWHPLLILNCFRPSVWQSKQ